MVRERLRADGVEIRERREVAARRARRQRRRGHDRAGRRASGRSPARTCWSPPAGAPTSPGSISRRRASPTAPKGIKVDARLRTSNRRVYAIGDVAGGLQFTHVAGYHAGIVIRNALFRLPAKVDYRAVPWVTYTDPELAHVGMTEAGARSAAARSQVLRWPFPRTTAPRPSARPRAWSRRRRPRAAASSAPPSSARMPAS